jgi:hypothetical protein
LVDPSPIEAPDDFVVVEALVTAEAELVVVAVVVPPPVPVSTTAAATIVAVFTAVDLMTLPPDKVVVTVCVVVAQPVVCPAVPVIVYQPIPCSPSQPPSHGPKNPQCEHSVWGSWLWTPEEQLE